MKYVDLKQILFPNSIVPIKEGGTGNTSGHAQGVLDKQTHTPISVTKESLGTLPISIATYNAPNFDTLSSTSLEDMREFLKPVPKLLWSGTVNSGGQINVPGYKQYSVFLFRPTETATIGVMSHPAIEDYSVLTQITGVTCNCWTGRQGTDGGMWRISLQGNDSNDVLKLEGCPYASNTNTTSLTWKPGGLQAIWGVI